jgi:hypothetical protein
VSWAGGFLCKRAKLLLLGSAWDRKFLELVIKGVVRFSTSQEEAGLYRDLQ